jgi:hypothetical protein
MTRPQSRKLASVHLNRSLSALAIMRESTNIPGDMGVYQS